MMPTTHFVGHLFLASAPRPETFPDTKMHFRIFKGTRKKGSRHHETTYAPSTRNTVFEKPKMGNFKSNEIKNTKGTVVSKNTNPARNCSSHLAIAYFFMKDKKITNESRRPLEQ